MRFDQPPVVCVDEQEGHELPADQWPLNLPTVAQLLREGMALSPGVTFLVGENGSGKSTLVEGIAVAFGLSPEGGTAYGRHATRASESPLHTALRLQRGVGAPRWGFFLRAETMHGWYSFAEQHPSPHFPEPRFHEMSHGESFLSVLAHRFARPGFYCLDEPEAALSFSSTLRLMAELDRIVGEGGQVLCATHSPLLAALPRATIIEVGEWGHRETSWEDLELVRHWRSYLDSPQRYLRHLLVQDETPSSTEPEPMR